MSRRHQKRSSINKKFVLFASVLVIIALVIASNFRGGTKSVVQYTSLASWNYNEDRSVNQSHLPLTVDLTKLPNWPTVKFNSSSLDYIIEPPNNLVFTLIYNVTVRQSVPILLESNLAQKLIVGGSLVYGYLHTNETDGLLANGSHLFEREFTLTYSQLIEDINWGAFPFEFIVGWISCADPSFTKYDFSLEIGYRID